MNNKLSKLIEITELADVLLHLNTKEQTIVAFDIDQTLITPDLPPNLEPFLGKLLKEQKPKQHTSHSLIAEEEFIVRLFTQHRIRMKPVEEQTSNLIKKIQKQGIMTIGLTARFPSLIEHTMDHLRCADINLSDHPMCKQVYQIPAEYPCLFQHGIIFCGRGNDKGTALVNFIDRIELKPEKIIFVDDEPYHINSVQKALINRPIQYTGMIYSRCKKI